VPPLDLDRLRHRLPASPLTRFAPSPTGFLHLGHAANAVFVWGLARALGGRVLLRLEDHDRGRCRSAYEAALFRDLDWLGLEADLGGAPVPAASPWRQSDCGETYQRELLRLAAFQPVYACTCSRKEIAEDNPGPAGAEVPYSGRCRDLGLADGPGRGLRLVTPPGVERFEDGLLGLQAQEPAAQCGDLLVRDRLGNWTYQFAVAVDDLRHGIALVIRGEDLLPSTGRQIGLARLLGRSEPAVFLHHPLVRKPSGDKLSKASRDAGIRDLRAGGAGPAQVLGEAAFRVGLLPETRPIAARELAQLFG
jgi:glutamyl-Q tRNA(Asp) synthetase